MSIVTHAAQLLNSIYSAKKYPDIMIAALKRRAETFRVFTILLCFDVNMNETASFMITVAGAQRGAVRISASPEPTAAESGAYGKGRRQAEIYMNASPIWIYPPLPPTGKCSR